MASEGRVLAQARPSRRMTPPCVQVTSSQLSSPLRSVSLLVLAESESEKRKWVCILEGLRSIVAKNSLKNQQVHILHEAYDASLPIIKTTLSAAVLGPSPVKAPALFCSRCLEARRALCLCRPGADRPGHRGRTVCGGGDPRR